jgi:hypothetical protein
MRQSVSGEKLKMKKLFALSMLIFSVAPACADDRPASPTTVSPMEEFQVKQPENSFNTKAQEIPNFYSAVCIKNEAGRAIKIQSGFNGGKIQGRLDGDGFNFVNLRPGMEETFYYRYFFPNENRAPRFIVLFSNIDGSSRVTYHTDGAASRDTSCERAKIIHVKASNENLYAVGPDLLGGGGP